MKNKFHPPYLGAAYYPEDWDEKEIDSDIEKMKLAGINAVRIGEFAWHKMEPKKGMYDFDWLHKIVDKLGANSIAVVLGTPSATPPRWFTKEHPQALTEFEPGRRKNHGGRRHCCSNNPDYRKASADICEKMAQEFANDENVIGWQIDNEIYESGDGCLCEHCRAGFIRHLENKFKTADNLNRAWNLNLFSQWYDSFEDIPLPVDTWVNPHHRLEWRAFQNESHVDFVAMQADILHKYVNVPIGTDTMPFGAMDYRQMYAPLDVVQFNHYNEPENLHRECFWFDHLRTLKDRPFWNTETATCWNGNTTIGQSVKPENFCYINSFLPIALGGETNMYWLWRTHWAGHEMMHGSVLDTSGRPQHIFGEVQRTADDFRRAADFINNTKVKPDAAFHYSSLNWLLWQTQHVVNDLEYDPELYDTFYRPLVDLGIRPDVIDTAAQLDGYKILFSPMALSLDENSLPDRIKKWIFDGGVWVAGPLCDVRDSAGAKYKDRPFGFIEDITGESWMYGVPDSNGGIKTAWNDGQELKADKYYQVFAPSDGSLASITEGHSELAGKSVITEKQYGKGLIIVLGTFPSESDVRKLYSYALKKAGLDPSRTPDGGVMVTRREGTEQKGLILAEYANKKSRYILDGEATDILTGRTLSGEIALEPYQVMILKY